MVYPYIHPENPDSCESRPERVVLLGLCCGLDGPADYFNKGLSLSEACVGAPFPIGLPPVTPHPSSFQPAPQTCAHIALGVARTCGPWRDNSRAPCLRNTRAHTSIVHMASRAMPSIAPDH